MKEHSGSPTLSPGQRAAAYWFVDGLPELVFGLALLLTGAVPIVLLLLHLEAIKPAFVATELLFLALFIWDRRFLGWLKARITYPRTGYVRPPRHPQPTGDDWLIPSPEAIPKQFDENVTWFRNRTVMPIFLGHILTGIFPGSWSPAIVILVVAASLYLFNRRLEHPYSLGAVSILALAGCIFHWIPLPEKGLPFVPLLAGGGWLLAQGMWTLIQYLRNNPREALPGGVEGMSA